MRKEQNERSDRFNYRRNYLVDFLVCYARGDLLA